MVLQEGSVAVAHSREALNSLVFIRNGHIYRILEKRLLFSSPSSSISTIVLTQAERSEAINYEQPEVTMTLQLTVCGGGLILCVVSVGSLSGSVVASPPSV